MCEIVSILLSHTNTYIKICIQNLFVSLCMCGHGLGATLTGLCNHCWESACLSICFDQQTL